MRIRIIRGARLSSDFSDKRARTEIVLKSNFHDGGGRGGHEKKI